MSFVVLFCTELNMASTGASDKKAFVTLREARARYYRRCYFQRNVSKSASFHAHAKMFS